MKTIADTCGKVKNAIIDFRYDRWVCKGSTDREQTCILGIPAQDLIDHYGGFLFGNWYTTSCMSNRTTADVWGSAKDDRAYMIVKCSDDLLAEYGKDFLNDLVTFVHKAEDVIANTDEDVNGALLNIANQVLGSYAEAKLYVDVQYGGLTTITDYDYSVGIDHEIATVCLVPRDWNKHEIIYPRYDGRVLEIVEELHENIKAGYLRQVENDPNSMLIYRAAGETLPEGWYAENILTVAGEMARDPMDYRRFHDEIENAKKGETK